MRVILAITLTLCIMLTVACSGDEPVEPEDNGSILTLEQILEEPEAQADAPAGESMDATGEPGHESQTGRTAMEDRSGKADEDMNDDPYAGIETIAVPGFGRARETPGIIRVNIGAVMEGPNPVEISRHVRQANEAMIIAAQRNGIKPEDIKTNFFQINVKHVYDPKTSQQRRDGFSASQQAEIRIRKTEQAGRIISEMIEDTGTAGPADVTVYWGGTELDDPQALRLKALEDATRNMWDQARTLAGTSGREVCRLLEAQAGGAGQQHRKATLSLDPYGGGIRAAGASYSGSSGSVSAGTMEETAWVTGMFSLTPQGQTREKAECGEMPVL